MKPYCLGIAEQTLNKMVLSSKVYKETFCLLVRGLHDLKLTECWCFQLSKKEKGIQFIVASQTVTLNLFVFIKYNAILGPSVWGWWTWLHGYNLLCITPRCVLPGLSLLKGQDTFIFSSSFPRGEVLKKSFHLVRFKVALCGRRRKTLSSAWILCKEWKQKIRRIFNLFFYGQQLIKVNKSKVRRTVWKQWKSLFKYFSWHTLKVLIATITRETSEIPKNPEVRCEHQETFHLD